MNEHFLTGQEESVFGKILFRMCNFSPGLNRQIGQDISAAFLTMFSHQGFVIQHRKSKNYWHKATVCRIFSLGIIDDAVMLILAIHTRRIRW